MIVNPTPSSSNRSPVASAGAVGPARKMAKRGAANLRSNDRAPVVSQEGHADAELVCVASRVVARIRHWINQIAAAPDQAPQDLAELRNYCVTSVQLAMSPFFDHIVPQSDFMARRSYATSCLRQNECDRIRNIVVAV